MADRPGFNSKKARNAALALGVAAAIGCAVLALGDLRTLLAGYLFAYLAACFVAAGSLGLLALGNLTGGKWAIASRPILTAGVDTTPLVAVLFLPVALGVRHIYVWASSDGEHMFEGAKAVWLSTDFFIGRAVAYLLIWLLLAILVVRFSPAHRVPGETTGMRRVGALTLVALIAVMTMAAFDWGMSLEPEWYSSIYGAILAISGVVAIHALVALLLCRLDGQIFTPFRALAHPPDVYDVPPEVHDATTSPIGTTRIRGDIGNLLLAFVMLWAYFSLSQLLIIWSGNLPSEIQWYLSRLETSWGWIAVGLAVLHFAVPFLLLISRQVKRSTRALSGVATLLLAMYAVNMFWTVKPAFAPSGIAVSLSDVVCLLAIGGLWAAVFLWRVESRWDAVRKRAESRERGVDA